MDFEKLLTIVTITKDNPQDLEKTVRSLKPFYGNNKVQKIIVDSSNLNTSAENKTKWQTEFEYHHQKPSGISSALNKGLELAQGRWVWFLHSGDLCSDSLSAPLFLELLEKSIADVMIFDMEIGEERRRNQRPPLYALWPSYGNWIPHPATLVRLSKLKQAGPFDPRYRIAMDFDYWFRLFNREDIRTDLISMPISIFDTHGASSNLKATTKESALILVKRVPSLLELKVRRLTRTLRNVGIRLSRLIRGNPA